ncbi:hypothetical protein [Amycolatopsis sp. cmx-4-83]|uniref:hypothetical protein n=1 Tax=Amycolatopsis sp. cmx-4-83 TaxID=2790940 RepID=UPI003979C084
MTQGAPRTTRTAKKPDAPAVRDSDLIVTTDDGPEFDLDAWLSRRGLLTERRLKVAKKSFRFTASATGNQIVEYNTAIKEGSLGDALAVLLVDPSEKDELVDAFKQQRQPLTGALEQEYFKQILNYVISGSVDGDAGESSAS